MPLGPFERELLRLLAANRNPDSYVGRATILGSVANVIVVESARRHVEVGFWDYARFGIPVTVLTTIAGMLILLLLS